MNTRTRERSHFFAYLSRMKLIRRWSLMRNTHPESIQEHSHRVAMIAHGLAVIRKQVFGKEADPERTALLAVYHDAPEVITGDLPTPIKHFNPAIKEAYKGIEQVASERLLEMLPPELRSEYARVFFPEGIDAGHMELVRAADKICAYLKCLEERSAGNREFSRAERATRLALEETGLSEVRYFLETFVPSFKLTLDELD